MKWADRASQPHTVYRIFNPAGELLYVGCTRNTFGRLGSHLCCQPWHRDIATVKVTWFDNWPMAAKAEQEAINAECPKHNKLVVPPENVGNPPALPRSDGWTCPKCGGYKERGKSYCPECTRTDSHERRIAAGWKPAFPVCAKCGAPKDTPQAKYCPTCALEVQKEIRKGINQRYQKKKKLAARGLTPS